MVEEMIVSEVLARYVRAVDRRDGKAVASLFTEDSLTEMFENFNGEHVKWGELKGSSQVEYAFGTLMLPHPKGGWSHHTTMDHIVKIEGDQAHLNAQFIMFLVRANEQPADPSVPRGGTITPRESGYYDVDLKKINDEWKIVHHRVIIDFQVGPLS